MSTQTVTLRPIEGRSRLTRGRDGVANLAHVLANAESSRVLNLADIQQRCADSEDYARRPLFKNKVLNRSIIMKFAPRPGELRDHVDRPTKSTKVLFPLDRNDLSLGGFSGVLGQRHFAQVMSRYLDDSESLSERDEQVLRLIDELPTLDPFLLYALLKSNGLEVSLAYFQLSEADRESIQRDMAEAFTPLVHLCSGEDDDEESSARTLIDRILNFEESEEIASLLSAFKLNRPMFATALFAWRGLIYYKWRSSSLRPALANAAAKLRDLEISGKPPTVRSAERSRDQILRIAARAVARVQEINERYDAAISEFVDQRHAEAFRQFLIGAPGLFTICGQSVAIIERTIGFAASGKLIQPTEPGAPDVDMSEVLRELERELGVDFRVREIVPEEPAA